MSAARGPTIADQVVKFLYENGPKQVKEMTTAVKSPYKSIYSKCLELEKMGMLVRSETGEDESVTWSLKEGYTPETLQTGEVQGSGTTQPPGGGAPPGGSGGSPGAPLNPRAQFEQLLQGTGVEKVYIPTISNLFFNGDIDKLEWLRQVLTRHAAGFVSPQQMRMIFASWSQARGLPYDPDEFAIDESGKGKGGKAVEKPPAKPISAQVLEEAGVGFKIGKDKDGDWVPQAGGPMTYEAAVSAAERRQALSIMQAGGGDDGDGASGEEPEGRPAPRGARTHQDFRDKFLDKVLDKLLDSGLGHHDEDSPALQALQVSLNQANQTIQELKEDREQDRLERMEANIAAIASRDPWSDPVEVARIRQALGVTSSAVTDSSPAVQLIKDQTDKMDKNVSRLVGIVERVILKEDVFRPEETRSPAEKEAKAGALLSEAAGRDRSRELRKRTFGN